MWEFFVAGYQAVCFSVESLGGQGLDSSLLFLMSFLGKGKTGYIQELHFSLFSFWFSVGIVQI
jgi:hypothetical protein